MTRRRSWTALAFAIAVAVIVPATASAYVIGGDPWPTTTITYRATTRDYAGSVQRAARIWNRAKIGVRLVRSGRRSAEVLIEHGGPRCAGQTTMGFRGWRSTATVVHLGAGCSKRFITLTAVHELGHVLGLDHERTKCARMNPVFFTNGTPNHCRQHSLSYWLAHPLTGDDQRGARYLYSR